MEWSRQERIFDFLKKSLQVGWCTRHMRMPRPQVGQVYLAPPPDHPTILPVATGVWIESKKKKKVKVRQKANPSQNFQFLIRP